MQCNAMQCNAMQCNVRLYLMYLTKLGARLRLVLHTRHPSFDRRRLARYLSSVRRRVASHTQNIRASPPALVGIRKDSTCVAKKTTNSTYFLCVSSFARSPSPPVFLFFLFFVFYSSSRSSSHSITACSHETRSLGGACSISDYVLRWF